MACEIDGKQTESEDGKWEKWHTYLAHATYMYVGLDVVVAFVIQKLACQHKKALLQRNAYMVAPLSIPYIYLSYRLVENTKLQCNVNFTIPLLLLCSFTDMF